ncbi:unnamed protein product [Durusdinium trenchii]
MVVILDDDQFPSNDFSQVIAQKSQAALWEVGGRLLWAFVRFCFTHLRTIRWKSLLVLFLSNLGNVYYLATIFMRVYLVDTVLNTKDPDTADRLWIRNDRNATAIALGLAWVLPNVILLASDYFEMAVLDMGHQIRFYLRAALFRKYLHYTEESRALVPIQALKASIMKNIPDLASQGYLILFHLWAMLGKIVMVSIFILREPPRSPLPLIVYPLFIATYMLCTQRQRLDLLAKESDAKTATNQCIMFMHKCDKLFAAYDKRAEVQRHFEDVLKNQRKWALKMKIFTFWDAKLIPLITKVVTGSYIGLSAWLVSTGNSTLGTIVATINVYEDLGNRFATICEGFKELSQGIGPLAEIVLQFNLATDDNLIADLFEMNHEYVLNLSSASTEPINFDAIPISFQNVPIDHSLSADFSTHVPQGSVVQIIGPHDSGKGRLLKRICELEHTAIGTVLRSPHLLVLNVPHEPLFLDSTGFFGNLHLVMEWSQPNTDIDVNKAARGRRILQRLGLGKEWILQQYDFDEAAFFNTGNGDKEEEAEEASADSAPTTSTSAWALSCYDEEAEAVEKDEAVQDQKSSWSYMSQSEKWRFQLARALVFDPHVLIVHRPVDELDDDLQELVLSLLREFVDQRGLEMNDKQGSLDLERRRNRTVLLTTGAATKTSISDYVWRMGDSGVSVVKSPPNRTGR